MWNKQRHGLVTRHGPILARHVTAVFPAGDSNRLSGKYTRHILTALIVTHMIALCASSLSI